MACADVANAVGRRTLFLGINTAIWSTRQFILAAQFARSHNVDSLIIKFADGTNCWYGGINGFRAIRDAVKAQGVGVVPYAYLYGNALGAIDTEINNLIAYKEDNGVVVADMEEQWNGQVGWAQHLCQRMQNTSGLLLISTWADPMQQAWGGVIQALDACTAAYMPQQYDDDLALLWAQFGNLGAKCLIPTVDLSNEFGLNHPATIAQNAHNQGHAGICVWYYDFAVANPGLFDAVLAPYKEPPTQFPPSTPPPSSGGGAQGDEMAVQLGQGIGAFFTDKTNGSPTARWRASNGVDLVGANLEFWRANNGQGGLPIMPELYDDGAAIAVCERWIQIYDPAKKYDNPPGSGDVYLMHIDSGKGQELIAKSVTDALNKRIADLQAQLATAQKPMADLQATITSLQNVVASLSTAATAAQAALHDLVPA